MSWTTPKTWTVGEILTAADMNSQLRDNLLETAVGKVTTAGDTVYATGANALARLAKGTAGQWLKQGASFPEWASLPGPYVEIARGDVPANGAFAITGIGSGYRTLRLTINAKYGSDVGASAQFTINSLANFYYYNGLTVAGTTVAGFSASGDLAVPYFQGYSYAAEILIIQDPGGGENFRYLFRASGTATGGSARTHLGGGLRDADSVVSRIDVAHGGTTWDGVYTLEGWAN